MEAGLQDGRTVIPDKAAFIRANTRRRYVPLVPEITLYLADEAVPLWHKTEQELGEHGLPPPFWAFAWAGGQALARYILDNPDLVRGKKILDLASGSGLVGIATMKAAAATADVADIGAFARAAITLNASINRVAISLIETDLLAEPEPRSLVWDVILAGDIFYERDTAQRAFDFLTSHAKRGAMILIGDPGRSYLPKDRLVRIADYSVPVTRDLEDTEIKQTSVWGLS
ncbi:MAG: methyltransferase [Bradyrhizobiaceae bacterium]|nr:MAG: methyltransferase [Bradyrhizobiaceae bacterium]